MVGLGTVGWQWSPIWVSCIDSAAAGSFCKQSKSPSWDMGLCPKPETASPKLPAGIAGPPPTPCTLCFNANQISADGESWSDKSSGWRLRLGGENPELVGIWRCKDGRWAWGGDVLCLVPVELLPTYL